MAARFIGAHMSAGKGLGDALRKGKEIGCNAVQVFTSSPKTWYAAAISPEKVADFKKAVEQTGIQHVVSHDSYLINLCSPDSEMRVKSFHGLKGEVERCALYGISWVVSHMGSHKGQGEDVGLAGIAEATLMLLDATPDSVTICMETTAGQGTDLNCRFEHLARILELTKGHPRLAVCVDTCHLFVSGYDLRKEAGWDSTWADFERLVGFDRLKVVHANDSKKGLGSKVDRHEHIGQGEIGPKAFELLVNDPRFADIPILLETPEADDWGHEENLAILKGLVHAG